MRTLIRVDNANCTYCMNDVRDALLARPLVHAVRSGAMAGYWELDHDHDDLTAITDLVRQSLHGWQVADNGEIIMIATTPRSVTAAPGTGLTRIQADRSGRDGAGAMMDTLTNRCAPTAGPSVDSTSWKRARRGASRSMAWRSPWSGSIGDDVFAIGDRCTHQNVSLSEGEVDEDELVLECWKHGSQFSLVTGEPLQLPALKPTAVYPAEVHAGEVLLTLP